MATPARSTSPLHDDAELDGSRMRRAQRKLLTAGLVGSSIEWYDFFLYGTAAALVFPHVFFPEASALTGTLLSFSTFWAGFLARPIGGLIAGHTGDRYGRKPVVVTCLMLMGLGTFLIGCLPGAGTIGVAAPILLVALRFVQGMACGGQWGGIVLLITESSPPKKRGYAGTFGQMGVPLGVMFGNLVFIAATWTLAGDSFLAWGWRIPFWFSALMFPVALFIQTKVEDSPEFRLVAAKAAKQRPQAVVRAPLAKALRDNWKQILCGCFLLAASNCLFYISIAGVLTYGTSVLGLQRTPMLLLSLASNLVSLVVILAAGRASDRLGRRPVVMAGAVGVVLWGFPYFWLVDTADLRWFFVAVTVGGIFQSTTYGPLAAYLSELFAPNVRLSSASLAYQLAAIVISGGVPFVMTAIIARTHSTTGVSLLVCLTGVLTLIAVLALKETNPAAVRADPDAVPGTHLYPQAAVVGTGSTPALAPDSAGGSAERRG